MKINNLDRNDRVDEEEAKEDCENLKQQDIPEQQDFQDLQLLSSNEDNLGFFLMIYDIIWL